METNVSNKANPAWRKLLKFVRCGVEIKNAIPNSEGTSRKERRKLERAEAKLKKSLEDLPFGIDWGNIEPTDLKKLPTVGGFISIFGRCEGFTYYLAGDRNNDKGETKVLGTLIGAKPSAAN